ncbi:MAG: hypothetical protein M3Q40_07860 [Pseudomonadota bacterium]|nr:hypothetical protein [Pseudomonadota bacterium]
MNAAHPLARLVNRWALEAFAPKQKEAIRQRIDSLVIQLLCPRPVMASRGAVHPLVAAGVRLMLQRVTDQAHEAISASADRASPRTGATLALAAPASMEVFLATIETRAFRFAEIGLRQRDDALDAVQDAMMKMLAYAGRPSQE